MQRLAEGPSQSLTRLEPTASSHKNDGSFG